MCTEADVAAGGGLAQGAGHAYAGDNRLRYGHPERKPCLAEDDVLCVGEGPVTVVALHGIQGTRGAWLPLARQLADRCTFILPNLPGRGTAAAPPDARDCSLEAYAAVVARVIETHVVARAAVCADSHTGTQTGAHTGAHTGTHTAAPFVLAGWSMGVSVALAYLRQGRHAAQRHAGPGVGTGAARANVAPPMPAALLLVSGTPCLRQVAWFASPGDAALADPPLTGLPPTEPAPTLLDDIAARERRLGLAEAAGHRTVAWTWMAIRRTDQRAELAAVNCPTLVVHGSADHDCPLAHGTMLAEGIAGAELLVLQGAGHSVLTERTADIAAYLRTRWPAS